MKKLLPLVALVLINLIVGAYVLPGFGESSDELSQNMYAERTIQAVRSVIRTGELPASFVEEKPQQGSHGPAFIVVLTLLRDLFLPDGTPLQRLHFNHYLYFMMFQVGTVSLYFLARRWVSETAALGTAILFSTQPLLAGHAFINPKDVVFMSLLVASAALGFWMVDRDGKQIQATSSPLWDGIRSFPGQFLRWEVWLAGLCLGFTSAVRIAGPLVGIVILTYILVSRRWHSLPRFFAYGSIALLFMIVFWPYLWPDPVGRLIECILNCVSYPGVHLTLFRGVLFDAPAVPRSYLPVLLVVQLTETTLLLVLVGALSIFKRSRWDIVALTVIWFALPVAMIIWMRMNLYNNFRQVFFILPPVFLIAGLGLDWLLTIVRRPASRFAILFLVLLPGLYANITLYPYQYVYYNQLAGGLRGAYRTFELDYWNLAFRECQSYINENADDHANIYVGDSRSSAQTFARRDLIFNAFGGQKKNWTKYDYLIVSTAKNNDQRFTEFPTALVVQREGVPLCYVKTPGLDESGLRAGGDE